MAQSELHDHDRGLQYDLHTLRRRSMLGLLGGVSLVAIAGCGDDSDNGSSKSARTSASTNASADTCTEIPEETAGPYPGDGSNGPNALTQSGIVRSDITQSFGDATGVATGVPFKMEFTIVQLANGCQPYENAAIYVWHCNQDGEYSMYGRAIENENYLRGVQASDANGKANFTSIFPACYSGRWPHVHFEVYPDISAATSASNKIATSQMALPQDACDAVYATTGYSTSQDNMSQVSLETDMVFSDGSSAQTPTMSGDIDSGYTAKLTIGV
ncbi:MAG: intradiol ring-cleavage dioxygenase [Corynebacteriales bacterium]|nr:intradiol ring-cleavage dioxygenase [Mycobacteriales bacterium]